MIPQISYPFVEVTWWDAHSLPDWVDIGSENWAPVTVLTRGWLVYEDGDVVACAGTLSDNGAFTASEVIVIPRGCIQRTCRLAIYGEDAKETSNDRSSP